MMYSRKLPRPLCVPGTLIHTAASGGQIAERKCQLPALNSHSVRSIFQGQKVAIFGVVAVGCVGHSSRLSPYHTAGHSVYPVKDFSNCLLLLPLTALLFFL